MRPERFGGANSLSVRRLQLLATILLALIVFQAGVARAAESAPQSSASPIYDWQSFIRELDRLNTGLENARKSTEALRTYRESLPRTWAVDAVGRRYDVPTICSSRD
jgi:hypothetical protein